MQLLDEKGRLFGKVNVVDVVVGAVVTALVVVAALTALGKMGFLERRSSVADRRDEDVVLYFVASIPRLRDYPIEAGDPVKRRGGVDVFGHVETFTVEASPREVVTDDGRLVQAESAVYANLKLTVRARGHFTEDGLVIGPEFLRVNEVLPLLLPGMVFDARLVGLDPAR